MNNPLINKSLAKSSNYSNYRTSVQNLLKQEKSTGKEQSSVLLDYSILNNKRMDRLDKTISLTEETKKTTDLLTEKITMLVIAEGWCGDAAQIIPVLNKIASFSPKIDLKIVLRDENEDLMNLFLTNGSKSIPKVIILNNENSIVETWGPRPSIASKMVENFKLQHGSLNAEFKKDLQLWYNKDKGLSIQEDFIEIFKSV
ncbi:thioredoxin family protein [Lutibacter sp.]|uniref:thioredoxin family protein n=1 Tax=Lutibacter sp. TaxID=1925666 RepID=UPI0027372523|nr:thioredoxin family protein [Lutibacter sp.]MDP3313642.1 thioredoxin family protein [Lutibacter sp.]